jgi:hypothetical protein
VPPVCRGFAAFQTAGSTLIGATHGRRTKRDGYRGHIAACPRYRNEHDSGRSVRSGTSVIAAYLCVPGCRDDRVPEGVLRDAEGGIFGRVLDLLKSSASERTSSRHRKAFCVSMKDEGTSS